MTLIIEIIIGIVLFTLIVIPGLLKDPLSSIGDYPPAICQRCIALKLTGERTGRFSKKDIVKKIAAVIVMALVPAFIMVKVNKADTFIDGALYSYILWLSITWYDAIVLDCIFFCHSEKVKIPGTEDMPEYKDYLFHIKQSCIGSLLGVPVCLAVGLFVSLIR